MESTFCDQMKERRGRSEGGREGGREEGRKGVREEGREGAREGRRGKIIQELSTKIIHFVT